MHTNLINQIKKDHLQFLLPILLNRVHMISLAQLQTINQSTFLTLFHRKSISKSRKIVESFWALGSWETLISESVGVLRPKWPLFSRLFMVFLVTVGVYYKYTYVNIYWNRKKKWKNSLSQLPLSIRPRMRESPQENRSFVSFIWLGPLVSKYNGVMTQHS